MDLANNAQLTSVQHMGIWRYHVTPDWHPRRHAHAAGETLIVVHGAIHVALDDATVTLTTGDVMYYPAGLHHREYVDGGQVADLFCVNYLPSTHDHASATLMTHDRNGRLRLLAQWLFDIVTSEPDIEQALLNNYASILHGEMLHQASDRAMSPMVLASRTYFREHLDQPLTVDDVARHVGMSRSHFTRRYKQLTGVTPWDDLLRLRVEATRNLLITTQLPLRAIAAMVGFSDEYHLSRVFRRYQLVAPGYYRKHGDPHPFDHARLPYNQVTGSIESTKRQ
jgi:AraC-like DNA-binding protein/mannose-6-phosphate isomerase-like protein (cupin superfamily)